MPIHVLAEAYLGLPLVHHLFVEDLADHLADVGRADFMYVVSPLRIVGCTGSPVSPLAIT